MAITFEPIDPSEFRSRAGRHAGEKRGEVAAPIVDAFLQSGAPSAKLDLSEMDQSHATLSASIRAYLKRNPELGVAMSTVAPDRGEDNKPVRGTGEIRLGLVDVVGATKPRGRAAKAAEADDEDLFEQVGV